MQRIDTATKFPDLFGAGKHGYRDGNVSLGIPATQFNAASVNAIQEEICSVIEGAGLALNPAEFDQMYQAIEALIASSSSSTGFGYSNLQITTSGSSGDVVITADEILLDDGAGHYVRLENVNVTANVSSSGANGIDSGSVLANTWYSIMVMWNGTVPAALLVKSGSVAVIPAGFTHYRHFGWMPTDNTANKFPKRIRIKDRRGEYMPLAGTNTPNLPIIASGASVGSITTPTWVPISIFGVVPPSAATIKGVVSNPGSGISSVCPNNSYGAYTSVTNPPPAQSVANSIVQFEFMIESSNIYWANNSGSTAVVCCMGWEDNLL